MSDPANVETKSPEPCEQLLDYVYGELDDAGKRAFEQHLAGCAKCQAEAQSFGRVRTATKRLLPAQDPPEPLGNALHAQLMHAAAQRKPKRGVLLSFPRKLLQHPGWAAAAMFVVIGGAVGINALHGTLMMPRAEAPAKDTVATPAPASAVGAPAGAPQAEPPATGAEADEERDESAHGAAAPREKAKELQVRFIDKKSGGMVMPKTIAKKAERPRLLRDDTAEQLVLHKSANKSGRASSGGDGDALSLGEGVEGGLAKGGTGGTVGGVAPAAPPKLQLRSSLDDKPAAPAEEAKASRGGYYRVPVESAAPTYGSSSPSYAQQQPRAPEPTAPAPVAAAPAPPPPSQNAPASVAESAPPPRKAPAAGAGAAASSTGPLDLDQQRKRADNLAHTNQCEEAVKVYEQLERRQRLNPQERANLVRCYAILSRPADAQQQLDALKQDKSANTVQVQQAESELSAARRLAAKKSKRSAPANAKPARAADQNQLQTLQPALK